MPISPKTSRDDSKPEQVTGTCPDYINNITTQLH